MRNSAREDVIQDQLDTSTRRLKLARKSLRLLAAILATSTAEDKLLAAEVETIEGKISATLPRLIQRRTVA